MMRRYLLAAVSCALLAASASAQSAPRHLVRLYKATLLTNPDTQFLFSALDLNNRGDVVGSTTIEDEFFTSHAAIWRSGRVTLEKAELPGTQSSEADGVNDHGDLVGTDSLNVIGDVPHAVLWHNGKATDLGTPPGTTYFSPMLSGLNNRRQVIGFASDLQGYLWTAGTFTLLALAPGGRNPFPEAINNAGHVAGWQSFGEDGTLASLWRNGEVELLGTLPGMIYSEAQGLNNADHVVGVAFTLDTELAFLWRQGTMTALPLVVAGDSAEALSINSWDQVTGFETSASDGLSFPVLWENGRAIRLSDLIRPEDKAGMDPHIALRSAGPINDRGQIIVYASNADPNVPGDYFYLFTPVYEWQ